MGGNEMHALGQVCAMSARTGGTDVGDVVPGAMRADFLEMLQAPA
jgi:hypothetical protein